MADEITVQLPNGGTATFPAGTTPERIEFELKRAGIGEKSAGGGVTDLLTKGADLYKTGAQWQGNRVLDAVTGAMDFGPLQFVRQAADQGAKLTGGQVPEWAQWLLSSGAKLNQPIREATGLPRVDAPGPVGKVIDAGVEGMLAGGPMGSARTFGAMLPNFVGGGVSNAAAQLTEGSPWQPVAKAAGGFFGAGAASAPSLIKSIVPSMVAGRTKDITPSQWEAGKTMQADAGRLGVPLMAHEALPIDRGHPLAQMFGDIAASPAGAPIQQHARNRLPGINAAITNEADKIAPKIADPKAVDIALAEAADAAVRAPKHVRSQTADPFYRAGKKQDVPEADVQSIVQSLDDTLKEALPKGEAAIRLRQLRGMLAQEVPPPAGSPQGTAPTTRYETNIGRLDEALKEWEHVIGAKAFDGKPIVPDTVRVNMQPLLGDLRQRMLNASDSYRKGHEVYAGTPAGPSPQTQAVTAAEQSGAGQIASAYGGKPDQARGLFGKWLMSPENARPATVKSDLTRLNAQDPNAARAALRLYVENHTDAAFKQTQAGQPTVEAGTKFTKSIAGTPQARANLIAAVEGVTGNRTTAAGFAKLLDILDRTGVTPNIGSPTATRGMTAAEAGNSGVMNVALGAANLSKGSVFGWLGDKARQLTVGKVYGQLADLTTQPEGVRKLHELALLNPQSARARALASTLLQTVRGLEEATP